MADECKDLPEECWEHIFTFLAHQHRHFDSLSLVCNLFLSITNQLRRSLAVSPPTAPQLPSLLTRFRHLKSIDLSQLGEGLVWSVSLIANSGLDLESINLSNQKTLPDDWLVLELGSKMKNLKTLICSKMGSLGDKDLVLISTSFPYLQELDISYPGENYTGSSLGFRVTDHGLTMLSRSLPELRKINLSGNLCVTDLSILALTTGCCVRLREIDLRDCDLITQKGIDLCLRSFHELNSISATGIGIRSINSSFLESFGCARGLSSLNLSNSSVSDELICSVTEAGLPLKKLTLSRCEKLSYGGIWSLLCKCQLIEQLGLEAVDFLTDQRMIQLSEFLPKLTSINLSSSSRLTISTIIGLARNCRMLEEIKMERTNLGKECEDLARDVVVNGIVRSLYLASNKNLSDGCITKIVSICPNVEVLDVSHCSGATEQGIAEILKSCCELRQLRMNRCGGIKDVATELEDCCCKLEVLQARRSGIDDKALAMIGKRCPKLSHLDLENCLNMTGNGVMEVVKNCKGLREINLMSCFNVSPDVVAWMVFSSSSLRKIIAPCSLATTEEEKNLYLRHGCFVCHS